MVSYQKKFNQALLNTQKLGLESINFNENKKRFFTLSNEKEMQNIMYDISVIMKNQLKKELVKFSGQDEALALSLISNCTPFHYRIKPYLEKLLGQKLFYTTGYISFNDKIGNEERTFHKLSLNQYEECIANKKLHSNHHVWLTTGCYELIDLTFGLTLMHSKPDEFKAVINHPDYEPWMSMITRHPSDLTGGMTYNPMIVGEEFYFKSGFDLELVSNLLYK